MIMLPISKGEYVLLCEGDVIISDNSRCLPHQVLYDSLPSYEDLKSYMIILGQDIREGTHNLLANTASNIIRFKRIHLESVRMKKCN